MRPCRRRGRGVSPDRWLGGGPGLWRRCDHRVSTAQRPFDFRSQLEQKYRDGLRRGPTTTFVDVEGDIVWTLEYLRYRLSACGHADAESRVFAQIDDRSRIPPTCVVCAGPPGAIAFLGWTTATVPQGSVMFSWEAAPRVVTSYVVELGTSRGASNLGVVEVSGAARCYPFFFSNSCMNETSASTPSSGNAL